jgi:glycosyltransferase involved in cell wall biosynthesis
MTDRQLSVVIPARNEAALLPGTIEAILDAIAALEQRESSALDLRDTRAELIVVDNGSTDDTATRVAPYVERHHVTLLGSQRRGAACARNDGARIARGRLLVFVDADTLIPRHALRRVVDLCEREGVGAGITPFAARDGGRRARAWWAYWNLLRELPIPRAKAMPAFLFCTREVFDAYGPFDEAVEIGEEWPILAGLYRREPRRFRYDKAVVCETSCRRMELQTFGYLRVFLRYQWAVLHRSGRSGYGDHLRHQGATP